MPRSESSSSTSRYEREKRKYQPTASRITSGSNWRHLNKPEIVEVRDIGPAYQIASEKLQHFLPEGGTPFLIFGTPPPSALLTLSGKCLWIRAFKQALPPGNPPNQS
jgi:hypothetical protein